MSAAETIKKFRLTIGLEQKEIAKLLEVSAGAVSGWEGGRRTPRLPYCRKFLEIAKNYKYKMTIEDLLT